MPRRSIPFVRLAVLSASHSALGTWENVSQISVIKYNDRGSTNCHLMLLPDPLGFSFSRLLLCLAVR